MSNMDGFLPGQWKKLGRRKKNKNILTELLKICLKLKYIAVSLWRDDPWF